MRLIRQTTLSGWLETAREGGREEGRLEEPRMFVAGADLRVRRELCRRVRNARGDTGRAILITKPQDLQGFRGGVLLCGHGTSFEIVQEAHQRGFTTIDMEAL